MTKAAHWLSVALHPLFMPLVALWAAFHVDPYVGFFLPQQLRWATLGMVLIMAVLFPLTSVLLLRRAGLVTDLGMSRREERIAPFVMTSIYYAMTYYLMRRSNMDTVVLGLFSGTLVALLATTLITLRWKISVHMVGAGGLVGTLAGIADIHGIPVLPWLAGSILLAGALGTARLLTGEHDQAQVYAGGALGFLSVYGCLALGLAL